MSTVVVVKHADSQAGKPLSREQYRLVLATGLRELTGISRTKAAIASIIPDGRVGLKTNCLPPRLTHTSPDLSYALTDLLIEAGFADHDLVIWERTNRELKRAGYELNASTFGVRCLGTDTNQVGYGWEHHSFGDVHSRISRIVTDLIDYNINLPVLKDHSIAGLSANLKNMYGAIHNPNKYHGNNCNPFAAQVSNLEPIRHRNRLSVIEAIQVQYQGGPALSESYLAHYGGLIIATDPVAADRVGLEIIERLRALNGLPTLAKAGRPVKWLKTAEEIGLGIADLDRIDLKVVIVAADGATRKGELL